jgi:hypothetical protein
MPSWKSFWAAGVVLLAAGCESPADRVAMAAPYSPSNIYLRESRLPKNLRRLAVLPIPRVDGDTAQSAGAEVLEPLLLSELRKTKTFDVDFINPTRLVSITGRSAWVPSDALPPDYFHKIARETGCDTVLFAQLTTYHAYPPLRIGWAMKIVDCEKQLTWWAVDEVFDAGNASVASGAVSYGKAEFNLPDPVIDNPGMLASPRRFGQYTISTVVGTIPGR